MSVLNPHLFVSLDEYGQVLFTRNGLVSDADWQSLVVWWSEGALNQVSGNTFSLPFDAFDRKKVGLRTEWKGSFSISDDLKRQFINQKELVQRFEAALNPEREVPSVDWSSLALKRSLKKQQKSNILSMISVPSGANFSVPGAGKTMTTLACWKYLYLHEGMKNLLIICPKSAFEAWADVEPKEAFVHEVKTQIFDGSAILPETQLLVANYEKLESEQYLDRLYDWVKKRPSMLVLDEAHRVKAGGSSIRWVGCKKLADVCKRVDLLTGTPMPQGYSDLRNLLMLSWKNLPMSKLTDANIGNLKPGGLFVRTTKSELNLPPLDIVEVPIEQSQVQKQVYSALKRAYSGVFKLTLEQEDHFHKRGRAVMTLIAASTNPGLLAGMENETAYMNLAWPPRELESDSSLVDVVGKYVSLETPTKYTWLAEYMKKAFKRKEKVLVWSSFIGNIKALERLLYPYNPAVVFGATTADDRASEISRFRNDESCGVLITNPQTLGEGISLHKVCHTAVYVDRTYNAGHYLQSLDRIHRLGLPSEAITKVYILKTENTVDDRISLRLATKVSRMADVLNDDGLVFSALPNLDEESTFSSLSLDADDISDILGHLMNHDT